MRAQQVEDLMESRPRVLSGLHGGLGLLFTTLILVDASAATAGVPDFSLVCAAEFSEGATAECTVTNTADGSRPWPGVVIFHKSSDGARALVRGRVDVEFGSLVPNAREEGALWWVGDTLIGYSRFDWSGRAGSGESRTVPIRALDDDAFEGDESFYVTLTPDRSRNDTALYYDADAVRVVVRDNDEAGDDASLSRLEVWRPGGEAPLPLRQDADAYAVELPYEATEVSVVAVPSDVDAVAAVAGEALEGSRGSRAIAVPVGQSSIEISVLAEDGATSRTYAVSAARQAAADDAVVSVAADGFELECPWRGWEDETLECTLTNTGSEARALPVIAAIHSSLDGDKAIVSEDSLLHESDAEYGEDIALDTGEFEDAQLETGYGELFSGGSRSTWVVYGFQKVDLPGTAAAGSTTGIPFTIAADETAETKESFHVALAPDGYTGLRDLVDNRAPIAVTDSRQSLARDSRLIALTLSGIDIGTFSPDTTTYSAAVDPGTETTTVAATPLHPGATVSIEPPDADDTLSGHQMALAVGANRVTVTVAAGEEGATASTAYAVTVTRPETPLTARFVGLPESHTGVSFVFRLEFSEGVAMSYVNLRDRSFQVANGDISRARRVNGRRDLWEITVVPSGALDVTLVLPPTVDCNALAAVCTAADKPLSSLLEATVPGPEELPVVSIAPGPSPVMEGQPVEFTLTRSGGPTGRLRVQLEWTASDRDDQVVAARGTFRDGADSATVGIDTSDDDEPREAVTVTMRVLEGSLHSVSEEADTASVVLEDNDGLDDASLASLVLSDVDPGPFDRETTTYEAEVANEVESTTVEATPTNEDASVEIADGAGSTAGRRRTSSLSVGSNEIRATATAEDGETTRTYTVTVERNEALTWGQRLPERDIVLEAAVVAGLWSDGLTIWVADWADISVRAYSLADGSRRPLQDLQLSGNTGYLADLWSDGETLWASDFLGGALPAYRLSGGERLEEKDFGEELLSAAGNGEPTGMWSDGEVLRVVDNSDGHVYAYSLSDGSRQEASEVPLSTPDVDTVAAYGLWSDGETLLVASYERIYAFGLEAGERIPERDIYVRSAGNEYARGIWSDGKILWVADEDAGKLFAYAVPGLRTPSKSTDSSVADFRNWAPSVPAESPGTPVAIPDPGLRSIVEAALGKSPGEPVGTREMASLEELDARGAGVEDLAGIEHAVNLRSLDLGLNEVRDLSRLAQLFRLEALNLDGRARDLSVLAGLSELKTLSLRDNGLDDLAVLSSLVGLRRLDVANNRIADLGPLASLVNLEMLVADGNAVRELTPLSLLIGLRRLSLAGNAIVELQPLSELTALVTLDLRHNRIDDFGPINGLPVAPQVEADGNPGAGSSVFQ